MRVNLLFPDQGLTVFKRNGNSHAAVVEDLDLETIFATMSKGDELIEQVVRSVFLERNVPVEVILFRQQVLQDVLSKPETFRKIYEIASEAGQAERKVYGGLFARTPSARLFRSVRVLNVYLELLRELTATVLKTGGRMSSEGMSTFENTVIDNLNEQYLASVEEQLKYLTFPDGVLLGAKLAQSGEGSGYRLLRRNDGYKKWWDRVSPRTNRQTFRIAPRDESGGRILAEIQDQGVFEAAEMVHSAAQHIKGFFAALRSEMAFYMGCLNCYEAIVPLNAPICWPIPLEPGEGVLRFSGHWATSLALRTGMPTVANDLGVDGVLRVVITGANSGGKSTWLRSVGQSMLMMQAGMFVLADSFAASIFDGLYTHFSRGEDQNLLGGRLDEELSRLSGVVDEISPDSILLMNESFSSTNELEGSAVAEEVLGALSEAGVRCFLVTHIHQLAADLGASAQKGDRFLIAERSADACRTYRILVGEPQATSFAYDLYRKIGGFGSE